MALAPEEIGALLAGGEISTEQARDLGQLLSEHSFSPLLQALALRHGMVDAGQAAAAAPDRSRLRDFLTGRTEEPVPAVDPLVEPKQEPAQKAAPVAIQDTALRNEPIPDALSAFGRYLRARSGRPAYTDFEQYRKAPIVLTEPQYIFVPTPQVSPAPEQTRTRPSRRSTGRKRPRIRRKELLATRFADQSLVESEELASETLAQLLARQGHYERAREMYRKLALVYPEKSAFFAEQIEKLKKT